MIKKGKSWTGPFFYTMGGISLGLQLGVKTGELVMTVMSYRGLESILKERLKFGVDIVIESGTKYLSGHSDCFCGIIACSSVNFKKIYSTKIRFGDFVSSENCFLAIRGLKTLPIRLENHFKNTKKVLTFLKKNQSIENILYPGMSENKNYLLWKKYHSIANGLISFKLKKIRDDNEDDLEFLGELIKKDYGIDDLINDLD